MSRKPVENSCLSVGGSVSLLKVMGRRKKGYKEESLQVRNACIKLEKYGHIQITGSG